MNLACIILAAGSSSRMTKYKQLLIYKGKTFVKHLAENISALNTDKVLCVTGFLKQEIEMELCDFDMEYIHNKNHLSGQTHSLKLAMNSLSDDTEAAMITLTDQPLIPFGHYQELVKKFSENPSSIIATAYRGTYGVPAIIPKQYFSELVQLSDEANPKTVLKQHQKNLIQITCEEAGQDIDTDEEYANLISSNE